MKWLLIAVLVLAQQPAEAPKDKGATEATRAESATRTLGPETNQVRSAQPTPTPAQASVEVENQGNAAAANGHTETSNRQTYDEDRVTQRKLTWFTGALAALGFLQLVVMFLTWLVYRRQAGIMEQQRATMQSQWATMQGQLAQMEASGEQTNKLVAHSGNQAEALAQAAEIAITQTRATINLVEAAQKSAEAAKISADLAARVSIPTLVVEKFEVGETGAANLEAFLQYPQISMTVKNCGQTPAFLKWWTVIFTADDLPDTPLYNKGPARGMVLEKVIVEPSRSYTLPALFFPYRTELPIKDVRAIIDRQATLSVYGFICYGDLFGSPLRRLKFCETALNLFDGPQPTINWFDFGEPGYTGIDQMPFKKPISGQSIEGQLSRAKAKAEDHPEHAD